MGIPNIRDRVVAMTVKLVLEPVFEADFDADSYGFRPGRDAHQALAAIRESISDGMPWLIDADVSKCFDTMPHDKLLRTGTDFASLGGRVLEGSQDAQSYAIASRARSACATYGPPNRFT